MKILVLISEHDFEVEKEFGDLYQKLLNMNPDIEMNVWLDTRGTIEKEQRS